MHPRHRGEHVRVLQAPLELLPAVLQAPAWHRGDANLLHGVSPFIYRARRNPVLLHPQQWEARRGKERELATSHKLLAPLPMKPPPSALFWPFSDPCWALPPPNLGDGNAPAGWKELQPLRKDPDPAPVHLRVAVPGG